MANATRKDISEFLEPAAEMQLIPEIREYSLKEANKVLADLKTKRIRGAKVLRIN
ncbi:MAG: hypothetical protein Q7J15_03390 [Candidatus Desulfaltia sp.]|nr:hypothetical protein [Candidatus Desulfaltia sp.]